MIDNVEIATSGVALLAMTICNALLRIAMVFLPRYRHLERWRYHDVSMVGADFDRSEAERNDALRLSDDAAAGLSGIYFDQRITSGQDVVGLKFGDIQLGANI